MAPEQRLISILRAMLRDTPVTEPVTFEEFKTVYKLAMRHDLAHIVYAVLKKAGRLPTPATDDERAYLDGVAESVTVAQYRYVKLEAEYAHIAQVLEREAIPYMPLKGAVMRVLYAEPWMRTSCDIDVLVHEEDLDRAVEVLIAEGFETNGVRNYHDISLFCDGVHLELHHNVLERMPSADAVLSRIWEYTVHKGCQYMQKPAFFLFHHLAHMAHHFLCGGCGIRTVMDLWLLLKDSTCSAEELHALCEEAGLSTFAGVMFALAEVWFDDGAHDEVTRRAEAYIFSGGAYGSKAQGSASAAARYGKSRMALRVALMPYEDLKRVYPQLDGKPLLTPYYQLCRIVTRLKQGRMQKAVSRIQAVSRQDEQTIAETKAFLTSVGLYQDDGTEE